MRLEDIIGRISWYVRQVFDGHRICFSALPIFSVSQSQHQYVSGNSYQDLQLRRPITLINPSRSHTLVELHPVPIFWLLTVWAWVWRKVEIHDFVYDSGLCQAVDDGKVNTRGNKRISVGLRKGSACPTLGNLFLSWQIRAVFGKLRTKHCKDARYLIASGDRHHI